ERARALLAAWDGVFAKDSVAAALYSALTTRPTAGQALRDAMPAAPTPEQLEARLLAAVADPGWRQRRWGQQHTRTFTHPLLRDFDLAPVERSGGTGTVEADGATYHEILDVNNWDRSLAI